MIEGHSRTSGLVLFKGPKGESESGIWICTPGTWHCHVTSDEFCHFLLGRCTYTHEFGRGDRGGAGYGGVFPEGLERHVQGA